MRKLAVHPNSSVDSLGLERFHPMSIDKTFRGNGTEWLVDYAKNKPLKVSIIKLVLEFLKIDTN